MLSDNEDNANDGRLNWRRRKGRKASVVDWSSDRTLSIGTTAVLVALIVGRYVHSQVHNETVAGRRYVPMLSCLRHEMLSSMPRSSSTRGREDWKLRTMWYVF